MNKAFGAFCDAILAWQLVVHLLPHEPHPLWIGCIIAILLWRP